MHKIWGIQIGHIERLGFGDCQTNLISLGTSPADLLTCADFKGKKKYSNTERI